MSLNVVVLLIYFSFIASVGIFFHRRSSTADDYIIGGRSLNYWVTALSAQSSDMSSWLFLAYPGLVYLQGLQGIWIAVGLILGMWATWRFVAPKLRVETEKTQTCTLTSYLSRRFESSHHALPIAGVLANLFFFSVYVASGFVGMGVLFETFLGINHLFGVGIAVVVVAAYTVIGGFYSVCWVDFFQALFLLGALVIVPVAMLLFGNLNLSAIDLFPASSAGVSTTTQTIQGIALLFGWGLGYFGQGHILSKFMGIGIPEHLRKSKVVGLSWQAICLIAATLVGLLAQGFFASPINNSELVFVQVVAAFFPPFLAGLILCGILAATISTIDSQVILLTSILSEDLYHRFFRKQASQREIVRVSRLGSLLVCTISFAIAATNNLSIMSLVSYAWSGLGSAFGPLLLASLHTRIRGVWTAVTGIVVGTLVAAIWPWVNRYIPIDIPSLVPGFCLSALSLVVSEWLFRRREQLPAE